MSTRIYSHSMSKVSGWLRHWTVFTHYKRWNPRGSRTLATETRKFELEKHKIQKGFGLVVVNEKFCDSRKFENLVGAYAEKKKIEEFCKNANITVNDTNLPTHDLKANEMKNLFNSTSKTDFSPYDAFICFISSHGDSNGIFGIDGEMITEDDITQPFKKCKTLVGKPKLFFIQSCRGDKEDTGVPESKVVADCAHPIIHPFEADILVAYSSANGYASYVKVNWCSPSGFIIELTKVFKKHAHNMNLTDMLTIVSKKISKENFKLGKNGSVPPKEFKQGPSFSSTLRKAVYFDVPEPNHIACIAERVNTIIKWIVKVFRLKKML